MECGACVRLGLGPNLVPSGGRLSGPACVGDREGSNVAITLSDVFTYLVYGVLKGFLLRVGPGQHVSMTLGELHSPIPLPLESRFKDKHSDCSKYGEHSYCHHNRYNIRMFGGGT